MDSVPPGEVVFSPQVIREEPNALKAYEHGDNKDDILDFDSVLPKGKRRTGVRLRSRSRSLIRSTDDMLDFDSILPKAKSKRSGRSRSRSKSRKRSRSRRGAERVARYMDDNSSVSSDNESARGAFMVDEDDGNTSITSGSIHRDMAELGALSRRSSLEWDKPPFREHYRGSQRQNRSYAGKQAIVPYREPRRLSAYQPKLKAIGYGDPWVSGLRSPGYPRSPSPRREYDMPGFLYPSGPRESKERTEQYVQNYMPPPEDKDLRERELDERERAVARKERALRRISGGYGYVNNSSRFGGLVSSYGGGSLDRKDSKSAKADAGRPDEDSKNTTSTGKAKDATALIDASGGKEAARQPTLKNLGSSTVGNFEDPFPAETRRSRRMDYDELPQRISTMDLGDFPYLERVRPERPSILRATKSNTSIPEPIDYELWRFEKAGDDWTDGKRKQLPASQKDLAKKARSKSKNGTALEQIQKMGQNRLGQVDELIEKISMQTGLHWEPAWMEDVKSGISRNNKKDVRIFDVIVARVGLNGNARALLPTPPTSISRDLSDFARDKKAKDKDKRDEGKDTKTGKYGKRVDVVDPDPFGNSKLFAPSGKPLGLAGAVPFDQVHLPPYILEDEPKGRIRPGKRDGKIQDGGNPSETVEALGDGAFAEYGAAEILDSMDFASIPANGTLPSADDLQYFIDDGEVHESRSSVQAMSGGDGAEMRQKSSELKDVGPNTSERALAASETAETDGYETDHLVFAGRSTEKKPAGSREVLAEAEREGVKQVEELSDQEETRMTVMATDSVVTVYNHADESSPQIPGEAARGEDLLINETATQDTELLGVGSLQKPSEDDVTKLQLDVRNMEHDAAIKDKLPNLEAGNRSIETAEPPSPKPTEEVIVAGELLDIKAIDGAIEKDELLSPKLTRESSDEDELPKVEVNSRAIKEDEPPVLKPTGKDVEESKVLSFSADDGTIEKDDPPSFKSKGDGIEEAELLGRLSSVDMPQVGDEPSTEDPHIDSGDLQTAYEQALEIEGVQVEGDHGRDGSMQDVMAPQVGGPHVPDLQDFAHARSTWYVMSPFARHPTPHVSHSELHPAAVDSPGTTLEKLKQRVESKLQRKVLWWPLNNLRDQCRQDQTRISWKCGCGAKLNVNISNEHAESFCQKMLPATQVPSQPPLLPTHQTQAPHGVSSGSQSIPLSTNLSGRPVPLNGSGQINNNTQTSNKAASARAKNPPQFTDKFLHWCVKGHTATTRVIELEMKDLKDETLVPRLLAIYNSITRFRSWLTFTSCAGVRFVKFRKLSLKTDLVSNIKDGLPPRPHPEYEYEYINPPAPEEEFIEWLQAVIAARIEHPRCPEVRAICNVLQHIPKKVNGKMTVFNGYGLYAVSAYCFWKAVLALTVASIPSVVFMIRWLVGHEGDWQNALAWLTVTYTIVNILVWQQDRWSVERVRL